MSVLMCAFSLVLLLGACRFHVIWFRISFLTAHLIFSLSLIEDVMFNVVVHKKKDSEKRRGGVGR